MGKGIYCGVPGTINSIFSNKSHEIKICQNKERKKKMYKQVHKNPKYKMFNRQNQIWKLGEKKMQQQKNSWK